MNVYVVLSFGEIISEYSFGFGVDEFYLFLLNSVVLVFSLLEVLEVVSC